MPNITTNHTITYTNFIINGSMIRHLFMMKRDLFVSQMKIKLL